MSFIAVAVMLFSGTQSANAQLLQGLAKLLGAKDDSPIMSLCQLGDQIGNAVVAKSIDDTINSYGTAQTNSYEEWADNWNSEQNKKLSDFNSEKEQYMRDYCKRYGFYDLWVERYGDNWFEVAGRDWFEKQNDLRMRRGEDQLLPYHLRGAAGEEVRYAPVESNVSYSILNDIGLSSNDLETANKWVESDKYGKRDMVLDAAFEVMGKHTDNLEMLESFRQLTKANNKYLKNKETKNPYTITERNIDFINIIYNATEISKEKKSKLLAEKRAICQDLMNSGIYSDEPLALEIAGQVLAIQKDKSLTDIEKQEWLCQLGYYGKTNEILQMADKINNSKIEYITDITEEPAGLSQEELEKKKRIEREEKEEREKAIAIINNVKIDKYSFNGVEPTDQHKTTLNEIAEIMNKHQDLSIMIIGHTCAKGYNSVNKKVGLVRANAAKKYLMNQGVDGSRIYTDTMGEEAPVIYNWPIENRPFNRRIEIQVKL